MENEKQFEKHYHAMSVKIVTCVYVSYRALKYTTLNCIINYYSWSVCVIFLRKIII